MSDEKKHSTWWHGLYLSAVNLLMKIGFGFLFGDKGAKYSAKFRYRATGLIADKTLKTDKCPLCGGALVERTGKKGKFMACSNFPKTGCRYTRNAH
jgi:ribosomal protein L37AE/L43A